MNRAETSQLLALIRTYDNRKTDDATVLSWHAILGDLDYADCQQAVMKHFATDTAYLVPAHIRLGVVAVRNERAAKQEHEIRALPSRFEDDPERAQRVQRGIAEIARRWSVPEKGSADPVRNRALERAKRERAGQPARVPAQRRSGGPGIQLDKVTTGPDWADAAARERASVGALHAAGRRCGRHDCPNCQEGPS